MVKFCDYEYNKIGFIMGEKDNKDSAQCIFYEVCYSNNSMRPRRLSNHFNKVHSSESNYPPDCIQLLCKNYVEENSI